MAAAFLCVRCRQSTRPPCVTFQPMEPERIEGPRPHPSRDEQSHQPAFAGRDIIVIPDGEAHHRVVGKGVCEDVHRLVQVLGRQALDDATPVALLPAATVIPMPVTPAIDVPPIPADAR